VNAMIEITEEFAARLYAIAGDIAASNEQKRAAARAAQSKGRAPEVNQRFCESRGVHTLMAFNPQQKRRRREWGEEDEDTRIPIELEDVIAAAKYFDLHQCFDMEAIASQARFAAVDKDSLALDQQGVLSTGTLNEYFYENEGEGKADEINASFENYLVIEPSASTLEAFEELNSDGSETEDEGR